MEIREAHEPTRNTLSWVIGFLVYGNLADLMTATESKQVQKHAMDIAQALSKKKPAECRYTEESPPPEFIRPYVVENITAALG